MTKQANATSHETTDWFRERLATSAGPALEGHWELGLRTPDAVDIARREFDDCVHQATMLFGDRGEQLAPTAENFKKYFGRFEQGVGWRRANREFFLSLTIVGSTSVMIFTGIADAVVNPTARLNP